MTVFENNLIVCLSTKLFNTKATENNNEILIKYSTFVLFI